MCLNLSCIKLSRNIDPACGAGSCINDYILEEICAEASQISLMAKLIP